MLRRWVKSLRGNADQPEEKTRPATPQAAPAAEPQAPGAVVQGESIPDPVQDCLEAAVETLLLEGPAAALRRLGQDEILCSDERILRRMQAIVFNLRMEIEDSDDPQVLLEPFLDPIYCQCSVCEKEWTLSPLLTSADIDPGELEQLRSEAETKICPACGRAYCRRCAATAGKTCTCGAALENMIRPNGRKRTQAGSLSLEKGASILDEPGMRIESPDVNDPNLHYYFGSEGKVPIGIDPTFPLVQTASLESHLDWAEALLEAGQYLQAQQQLDLLGPAWEESGRGCWLRARLLLRRYENWDERRNRKRLPDRLSYEDIQQLRERISQLLERASELAPDFGPAWVTRAEIALKAHAFMKADPAVALEAAQEARRCLSSDGRVAWLEGAALFELERYPEAAEVLREIQPGSAEYEAAERKIWLAELYLRCASEPGSAPGGRAGGPDTEAFIQLGYWLWRHDEREAAGRLFDRLAALAPDNAESSFVQGLQAWFRFNDPERYNQAHHYFQEALQKNPNLGLAFQFLGIIYHALKSYPRQVDFDPGDAEETFRKAISLDPHCELAYGSLGDLAIEHGDLATALEMFEKAAGLETSDNSVYLNLSAIYLGTRQFEKQDRALQKAKALEPTIELSQEYVNKILALCEFEY